MEGGNLMRTKYMVCPVCGGEGKTINPNIDAHGLTAEDFRDDPDFAEDYRSGLYDVTCGACCGKRVITKARHKQLQQNAENRRLAAREDGDWEAYQVAGDYRFG
jgi:DNA-directed RNA polymerase subunit RPC12/RpoP